MPDLRNLSNSRFWLFFSFLSGLLASLAASDITIIIEGIRQIPNSGIGVSMFDKKEYFPGRYIKAMRSAVLTGRQPITVENMGDYVISGQYDRNGNLKIIFENVPPGDYAISGLHDEDGDLKLRKNFIGIPQEGFFSSGNKRIPTYQNSLFKHSYTDTLIQVTMIYW